MRLFIFNNFLSLFHDQLFDVRYFAVVLDAVHINAGGEGANINSHRAFGFGKSCLANLVAGHIEHHQSAVAVVCAVVDADLRCCGVGVGAERNALSGFSNAVAVFVEHLDKEEGSCAGIYCVIDGYLEQSHRGICGNVKVDVKVVVCGVAGNGERCRRIT